MEIDTGSSRWSPLGGGLQQVLDAFPEAEILRRPPDLLEGHQEDDHHGQKSYNPAHGIRPHGIHIVTVLGRLVLHPVEEQNEQERGWGDITPHDAPEKVPEPRPLANHALNIIEEPLGSIYPGN